MIDQLRQLAIFAKTIDHGSFRGAARELALSPSVVSHHVSQLEAHLGVTLIYRSTRKLKLTREGERLLSATHKMLEAVEQELLDLSATASEPSGELRITIPSVLSESPFTDAIATFSLSYPRIRLALDFSDVRKELIAGGFDVAIRMGVAPKQTPTSKVLFTVRRRLAAATSYLEGRPATHHPSDVEGWDWLMLTPAQTSGLTFNKAGARSAKIKPTPRLVSNDARSLYRLARSGRGLVVSPQFLVAKSISDGDMVDLLPEWELRPLAVFAEWPANVPKHGLVKLLVGELGRAMLDPSPAT